MNANTLFLRLEGPMQAWGDQQSKFVVRRTAEAPTKSGVIGLLCAALGVSRPEAPAHWLPKLAELRMGVRIDEAGVRWWDYHTVGARMRMRIAQAEGKTKPGALLSRREYLCDASFLVALQGDPALIARLETAVRNPKWTLYLGRKCCPPGRPLLSQPPIVDFPEPLEALASVPWRPPFKGDKAPENLDCLIDWAPTADQPEAPEDALVWCDVPVSFEPPAHVPRFVVRQSLAVGDGGRVRVEGPLQKPPPAPSRPRADYKNTEYAKRRQERLCHDNRLCVFCKAPATTVQHVTYRHAGGQERIDELRSLCRLCHDAVTMLEYGLGMGMDRINPEEARWRDRIIEKRKEIVKFRSLETRRRRLSQEEVE